MMTRSVHDLLLELIIIMNVILSELELISPQNPFRPLSLPPPPPPLSLPGVRPCGSTLFPVLGKRGTSAANPLVSWLGKALFPVSGKRGTSAANGSLVVCGFHRYGGWGGRQEKNH